MRPLAIALALSLGACATPARPDAGMSPPVDLKAARALVTELIRSIERGEREPLPYLLSLSYLARVTRPPDLPRRPGSLRRFTREVVERLVDPSGPVRRLLAGAQVTGAQVEGHWAVVRARSSTATIKFVVASLEGGLRIVRIE